MIRIEHVDQILKYFEQSQSLWKDDIANTRSFHPRGVFMLSSAINIQQHISGSWNVRCQAVKTIVPISEKQQ